MTTKLESEVLDTIAAILRSNEWSVSYLEDLAQEVSRVRDLSNVELSEFYFGDTPDGDDVIFAYVCFDCRISVLAHEHPRAFGFAQDQINEDGEPCAVCLRLGYPDWGHH